MVSATSSRSIPCCPSFWDDQRPLEEDNYKKGPVTHLPSGDVYGKIFPSDPNPTIQKKMALLFAGSPLIITVRAIARIGHILTGQWVWGQAEPQALKNWKTERLLCVLNNKPDQAPGRINLYTKIALHCLYRLAEVFLKLITQPIALLFAMGSALLASIDPLLARRFFAKTEELWSIDLGEFSEWDVLFNYSAPCMQPERVANEKNFYKSFQDFDPETIRSQIFSLKKLLDEHLDYFSESDSVFFKEVLGTFEKNLPNISPKDREEQYIVKSSDGNPVKQKIVATRDLLKKILETVRFSIEKIDLLVEEALEEPLAQNFEQTRSDLAQELKEQLVGLNG